MRSTLAAAFILVMTSSIVAAERPQAPASFAPVAVVGVTWTAAPRGVGIGFAAPSNLARKVVDDIVAHGRVVRGWLGIAAQPLTAELARAFRVPLGGGLLLADVTPGGPAAPPRDSHAEPSSSPWTAVRFER